MDYKILVDTPANKPALGFENYANALASLILGNEARFAIGVFGSWGSGKTTLMNAVRQKVTEQPQAAVLCDFSAWRYQQEQHLIVPLLDTIKDAILEWGTFRNSASSQGEQTAVTGGLAQLARKTAVTISRTITALLAGISLKVGLPHAIELSYEANKSLEAARNDSDSVNDKTNLKREEELGLSDPAIPRSVYYACFRALKQSFQEFVSGAGRPRIVVFVDDLDRCLPAGALQILESIKLFFDLDGFVFVVGVDNSIVERFVEQQYFVNTPVGMQTLLKGSDYLKKVFQVPFSLRPVAINQLQGFIKALCDDTTLSLPAAQQTDLHGKVLSHLEHITIGNTVNARQVKRFINAYSLQMLIKPTLNKDAVLAVLSLDFREDWAEVQAALQAYGSDFAVALGTAINEGTTDATNEFVKSVPESLRTYLQGPAAPLLDEAVVGRLDEYIFSGAAVSDLGPDFVELQKKAVQLKTLLRASAEKPDTLKGAVPRIKELASLLMSSFSTFASYGPEPIQVAEDITRYFEPLVSTLPPNPEVFKNDALRFSQRLQSAVSNLRRKLR